MATVSDILKSVGGITEQDASEPTGDDLTTRINYVNSALNEWADAYDWDELKVTNGFSVSIESTVSLGLPTNFRKDKSALYIYSQSQPTEYILIDPKARFTKDSTDRYGYIMGSYPSKYLTVPNGLVSGASAVMDITIFPSSLASLNDFVPLSSSQYLVKSVIAKVFESRSDNRFPIYKSDADRLLGQMVEQQNSLAGGKTNTIPYTSSFRLGYDG